ncbi:PRTRC system ThiF family protein [Chlorogloea sp. CCALA 695]|uniref:PRTRC system ThiF family protein n=1 Tax=Chlorogloea sp. CCALA 695 TaxID=2107693 RepID=UPI000D06CF9C|nr:PRTRC system ThiF family protein [Chlorogloea sp. CCALA 695]PSB28524.1 PRTRC system ThiF family protein [Chlorogloea sp. CCALA 695]
MQIDLSYSQAVPLIVSQHNHVEFVLVGAGGTGGFLISAIARLMKEFETTTTKTTACTIIDPDIVEAKNIPRQNFQPGDIGLPKAEVLAARYALAMGCNISAISQPFTPVMAKAPWRSLVIIVGCVDNAAARQEIAACLNNGYGTYYVPDVWWLDCGNHRTSGQVLLGSSNCFQLEQAFDNLSKPNFCKVLPSPIILHPELLEALPEEKQSTPLSCAELVARNQQSLFVNQHVAAIASEYLLALTLTGGLRKFATYFDINSGASRSLYTNPDILAKF